MVNLIGKFRGLLKGKILIFIAVFAIFGAVHTAFRLSGGDEALEEARERLSREEAERVELEGMLVRLNSQDYIEREARDKLGVAREGETIVVLPNDEDLRRFAPREDVFDAEFEREKLPIFRQWVRLFLPELERAFVRG